MLNQTILTKVKLRLNKLDSLDYPDLPVWTIEEAFNQAQSNFTRKTLQGIDQTKTGAEGSTRRIDDLNVLLTDWSPPLIKYTDYYETTDIPTDYLQFSRVSVMYNTDCCPPRKMVSYLKKVADVELLLRDSYNKPSAEWAETFHVIQSNRYRIYTDNTFTLSNPVITYYRSPRRIAILGSVNIYTGLVTTADVECEFADDVIEVLINDTCSILAGDIENDFQLSREQNIAQSST